MLAPTGSGKTLAAFLACIDRLLHSPHQENRPPGPRVLYISPLKALAYDIEINLRVPLSGIVEASEIELPEIAIDVRTGDTPASTRRKQARNPGDILITTPESLYLLLGSKARETLRGIETVIVDEIHAIANNKRGTHLALSLERLDVLCRRDVQRIGLSATQRPLERIARLLGGDRKVDIVDCSTPPSLDLKIIMPKADLEQEAVSALSPTTKGAWTAILPHLLKLIRANTTTLLFCNSRRLAERIAQELNDISSEELCRAHHGSVAQHQRKTIEGQLKRGELRALVATSSLELGIDMATVDLVIQIASPGSVAQGLQRVGRAGHGVNIRSHGVIVPKFKGDLLEATVIGKSMIEGRVEESVVLHNCLDVLSQQIVAMVGVEEWNTSDLLTAIRRSEPYRELSTSAYTSVLDMLSGNFPSYDLPQLYAKLSWDRQENLLTARKGSKMLSLINGGTIPDRGLYAVHLGHEGPRIGELDEEMVYEAKAGETFFLGASTWRILEITRDQVIVAPAPGESGKMPFWRGEGPGRPASLGKMLGEFCRETIAGDDATTLHRFTDDYNLDDNAVGSLIEYLREQEAATGIVPSDQHIVIERFPDEVGDWRLCILTPYGSRVHAPWAMAIDALLTDAGYTPQLQWTDDGIALHLPNTGRPPKLSTLIPSSENFEQLLIEQLGASALFASRFRENAARALLLPKQRPGKRSPLWLQRLKAQQLLAAVKSYPSFPIVVETYRECMQEAFDVPALRSLLGKIEEGSITVHSVETPTPSPFARGLVYSFVAAFLYEGDAPSAERSAQALNLDQSLLHELLGSENLRDFLILPALHDVHAELQWLTDDRKARDADELSDLLSSLGALSLPQLQTRCTGPLDEWLEQLERSARACQLDFPDGQRWIACCDAGLYRDAFHIALPPSVPESFLAPQPDALLQIILRYARRRIPFATQTLCDALPLSTESAEIALSQLQAQGRMRSGEITPGRSGSEWCHSDVLKKIRRRSLEHLRGKIAPVSPAHYAAFLCQYQGITAPGQGIPALREAISRLAGLPIPWSELESRILPARVSDYKPHMLDSLCASGELVWIGEGSLGTRDGKIRLVLRHQASSLLQAPAPLATDASPLARQIDEELQSLGASFLFTLPLDAHIRASEELEEALAYLIWSGRITNDTLAFLRGIKSRPKSQKALLKVRTQRRAGRWSSTVGAIGGSESTQRIWTKSQAVLDCFPVVSRALGNAVGGGYAELARIYRTMEEQGKLRRGNFVEGLEGSQFARSSVIDALRNCRPEGGLILAACDPANPWGLVFRWPKEIGSRRSGGSLLLWDGKPVCFLESGNSKLRTYCRDDSLDKVIRTLLPQLATKKTLRLRSIDGTPASGSDLLSRFLAHDFRREQDAIVLERYR